MICHIDVYAWGPAVLPHTDYHYRPPIGKYEAKGCPLLNEMRLG